MSSVPPTSPPPNTPPGAPPPGYDPREWRRQQKDYWRAYREQQRAQWRTQRDQWRAQQQALHPRRRSVVGPVILIGLGILFLLVVTGHMEGWRMWEWFGRWWPVLLIAAGVGHLIEWIVDRDNPYPSRSSGFVGLLVIIVIVGIIATTTTRWGNSNNWNWNGFDNDDDLGSLFHGPEHDFTSERDAPLPAGNSVAIVTSVPGDVSVLTGSDPQVHIVLRKKIYGEEKGAEKRADAMVPEITSSGTVTTIRLTGASNERGDLEITLPAAAALDANVQHGDLSVTGRTGTVSAQSHHGDYRISDITGNVNLRGDHGDCSLNNVHGDVQLSGNFDDVTLGNVIGRVGMDGDFTGDTNIHQIDGAVHFHTSRTDLQAARILDQLTMDNGDLHVVSAAGPFQVRTHAYDIELTNVSGDISVVNSDGSVDITPANPLGNIQVDNRSGSTKLILPANGGFQISATAHNGDIQNEFGLSNTSTGDRNQTSGSIGNGALHVTVSSENGDISIHKAEATVTIPASGVNAVTTAPPDGTGRKLSSRPEAPKAPKAPRAPAAPAAPAIEMQ
jgi:DUF4097 and DUF4098 domain-containing protein YvlB